MTPDKLFDLTGKTALITGGASGIGFMAAEGFMGAGCNVMIASRKARNCEGAAAELNKLGLPGKAEGFAGDVGSQEGVEALVAEVMSRTDRLDILMNNAGKTWGAPLEEFPYEGWSRVFDVNVTGMFYLTQKLLPLLRNSATPADPARVINVGSIGGWQPRGGNAHSYGVSKAAVHFMTQTLASKLAEEHITVNAIAPGPFMSKMMAFAIGTPEQREKAGRNIPLGRVGEPEDIQGAVLYLASRAGAYVTGHTIPIAGGANAGIAVPANKVKATTVVDDE
ncbi:SDR family oxidoreductase [Pseudooceanicola sp. 216_PA32_1]|uniref:SDR family oxidoreductase n=1 Tax=Pseudooceanicola pacificus TaxID=2676438 RepID=A0A844VXP2_9RHOB|nr:SDR family oxidoreductase [Pseudooceanicola pacificus]MWB76446.1 SDR family oxidoreductase [Pseudooceanicola pacificus]